jgi:hypothetical protein
MADRYVWSKTLGIRIPCDGPSDVLNAQCKLEALLKAENKPSDVDWEFVKRPVPRRRALHTGGPKRGTKLSYK